jgi:hypothetical protein
MDGQGYNKLALNKQLTCQQKKSLQRQKSLGQRCLEVLTVKDLLDEWKIRHHANAKKGELIELLHPYFESSASSQGTSEETRV